ncbi:MAG TPA: pitrilysin family protein [Myxococcota bacterium]|nr:pitrilysin family protein [Myxococcota bacterium]
MLLALSVLAPWASAQTLTLPNERYELSNGLEVVLIEDHSAPIVHVQIWYHVGSKDEVVGRTGFAHLFEHLMFQGSLSSPGEYFTPIQEVGGNLNGTTNSERTNYYETVPARFLPLALFMESDRMGHLLEVLDQPKLDNQRDVVRNERRQRYENPPYGEAWSDLMAAVFPEGHPYHTPTIGSHADLEAATLQDVSAFFKTWYLPNNASLVVAGDFDPRKARKLIEQDFGWIPRGPDPAHRSVEPVTIPDDIVIRQTETAPDHRLWMAWTSPLAGTDADAALDLASNILCGGKDSRLYDELVRQEKVAREISCSQGSRKLGSAYVVTATAAAGHTTDEIVPMVLDALHHLSADRPPTDDEVQAAKASYEVGFYQSLETIQGKASMASFYLDQLGEPDHLQADLDRYLKATPASIAAAIADVLGGHHVELHITPAEEAK